METRNWDDEIIETREGTIDELLEAARAALYDSDVKQVTIYKVAGAEIHKMKAAHKTTSDKSAERMRAMFGRRNNV